MLNVKLLPRTIFEIINVSFYGITLVWLCRLYLPWYISIMQCWYALSSKDNSNRSYKDYFWPLVLLHGYLTIVQTRNGSRISPLYNIWPKPPLKSATANYKIINSVQLNKKCTSYYFLMSSVQLNKKCTAKEEVYSYIKSVQLNKKCTAI